MYEKRALRFIGRIQETMNTLWVAGWVSGLQTLFSGGFSSTFLLATVRRYSLFPSPSVPVSLPSGSQLFLMVQAVERELLICLAAPSALILLCVILLGNIPTTVVLLSNACLSSFISFPPVVYGVTSVGQEGVITTYPTDVFKKSSDVIVNNLMVVHLNIQMTWTSFLNKIPHKMQELENLCSSISVKKLNLYLKTFSE